MTPTNWVPGLIVLALGVVISLIALASSRRKAAAGEAKDEKRADLEERLELLMDQLRGLEAERHQLGDRFDAERSRLESEAAQAMRARDVHLRSKAEQPSRSAKASAPAPEAQAPQGGFLAGNPQLKGALYGAGVVLFLGVIALSLQRWEGERQDDGTMTGRMPPSGMPPGAMPQGHPPLDDESPAFREALARAKADPRDVEAAAFAAHELIRQQRFEEADQLTRTSLAADPFHLESRIHLAVLRATTGEGKQAIDDLGHLASTYPQAWEALLFRGALALQLGDHPVALESFERFLKEAPADEHPPQLGSAIAMLRQRMGER